MSTIAIDRVLRNVHLTSGSKEGAGAQPNIADRIKDWAETYAAFKIEKEDWQWFAR